MEDIELAAILCTRICHDLVGPVGALGNGVEVLAEEDDPEMQRQAVELLGHSAEQATRRLRFYRMAFGMAKAAAEEMAVAGAREVAQALLEGGRVELDWPATGESSPTHLSRAVVKLLLNTVLVASEALPRGGRVGVAITEPAASAGLRIEAEGDGARLSDAAERALAEDLTLDELEPRAAPVYLARRLAGASNRRFEVERSENLVRFTMPPIAAS
jgi:histidine phosphotransferase ChpT